MGTKEAGSFGSGGHNKKEFSKKDIENIRRWRSLGHSWTHIAYRLGFKSETPIENFRRENPWFDEECGEAVLNLESVLIQDLIKLIRKLCADGKSPPPEIVKMVMQYFKVFEKDSAPLTAIQLNNSDSKGLQVKFVKPNELTEQENQALPEKDVIDV